MPLLEPSDKIFHVGLGTAQELGQLVDTQRRLLDDEPQGLAFGR